jgi:hypothetical protein
MSISDATVINPLRADRTGCMNELVFDVSGEMLIEVVS